MIEINVVAPRAEMIVLYNGTGYLPLLLPIPRLPWLKITFRKRLCGADRDRIRKTGEWQVSAVAL